MAQGSFFREIGMNELLPCLADSASFGRCSRCGYHRQWVSKREPVYKYARCYAEPPSSSQDITSWRALGKRP